ncbi:hypothetical protein AA0119_g12551 [Alternaria tenuissima]|uniref:Uncharacterized protein n=1 Tax=Alternaria tenuissima TaxID=119927 RepID=A0ABY0FSR7_9PLEO|nr:hypothetical protein AA0119_g12551 [Alternaria tenuissima]RYO11710.1 hypothetical protein AA0121_g9724 [Alternaria tenuissima]
MNNMDSMNDGPDDTNDIGDMSAFLDWTFASTLEPTDSQISTFVGNGYGSSWSQNMMAHYRLEEPYAGVASNSATDNAAYCGGQTLAPTAINDQVFLVEEHHEQ